MFYFVGISELRQVAGDPVAELVRGADIAGIAVAGDPEAVHGILVYLGGGVITADQQGVEEYPPGSYLFADEIEDEDPAGRGEKEM